MQNISSVAKLKLTFFLKIILDKKLYKIVLVFKKVSLLLLEKNLLKMTTNKYIISKTLYLFYLNTTKL